MLHSLLADLLSRLQADGFEIGIGRHLQVQELVERLPDNFTEEELGSFICPLFARNPSEQERFYELYRETLAAYRLTHASSKSSSIPKSTSSYKWLRLLGLAAMAGLVGLVFYLGYHTAPETCSNDLSNQNYGISVYPGDTAISCKLIATSEMGPVILDSLWFVRGPDSQGKPEVRMVQDTCLAVTVPDSLSALFASDTIRSLASRTPSDRRFFYKALFHQNACSDTLGIMVTVLEKLILPAEQDSPSTVLSVPVSYDTLVLPYPRGLASLSLPMEEVQRQNFLDENFWWIKLAGVASFMLALWAFLRYRKRQKQEVIAALESRDQPPFVWDILFPENPRILSSLATKRLIKQFRRRGLGEQEFMDMNETVRATVRNAGRLTPQYQTPPQSADYLLLINSLTRRDHRAQFYNYLFQLLKSEEVHIERFYYKGDPRLCWNEQHPRGLSLQTLAQRYGHHRLVVLSSGYEFFNPVTGRLTRWSKVLENWKLRTLLSPKAWNIWGRKEFRLGQRLSVVPASADALHLMVQQWNSREELSGDWAKQIGDALEKPISLSASVEQLFTAHLPQALHNWVAACAIFPSLQWELTLFLGKELSELEGKELLTTQNLQELSRLPWFVEGKMSDEVREHLLERLDDRFELALRVRLQELFESIEAPNEQSGAFDDYTLSLVINELHLNVSPERRRELKEQLAAYLAAGVEADWVVLKALEKPREGIDYRLPKQFRKLAERGQSADTKKSQVRQNIALGILGALLLALLMPFHPQLQTCVGPQLKEGSLVLCLEDYSDSLVYYQHKIGERLKVYDFKGAEDTLSQVLGMAGLEPTDSIIVSDPSFREFFTNVSFVYFNQGITYLNRKFVAGYNAYGTVLEDTLCNQLMQRSKELQPQDSRPLDSAILLQSQSEETDVMRTYRYICGPLLELGLNNSPCLDLMLEANALIERKASPNQFQKLIDRARRTCPQNLDALRAEYDKLVGQTQETPPLSSASTELDTTRTGLALEGEERLNLGNSGFLTVKGEVLVPASEVQGQNYTLKINSEPVRTVSTGSTTNRAGERRESFSFILEVPSGQTTRTLSIEVNSDVYEDINDSQDLKLDPSGQSEFTLKPIRLVLREERSVNTAPILPDMIYVRGGNFLMGSTNEEVGRGEDEVLHRVRLDDYEIGRYEVTNREYAHFLNANVDREDSLSVWIDLEASNSRISFSGESYSIIEGYDGHPVRYVSWYGAQAYCRWLNEAQAGGKTGWRLPSEAQWEYAAAGGVRGYDPKGSRRYMYAGTSNGDSLSYYANYGQNLGTEDRVGAKYPNPLGIHDMSGNVWEWCGDWYGEYQGEGAELQNPLGPTNEYRRVVRGGSWFNVGNDCRVSVRSLNRPADRDRYLGFRVSRYSPR